MASTLHLSKLQNQLYREKAAGGSLSRTFQSSLECGPADVCRITTYPDQYKRYTHGMPSHLKQPWGRARSYAGDAPVTLPTDHRPKCEPPMLMQRGHNHFGSGLFAHPRGLPQQQFYDLTLLKKSKVRWNDELLPRPNTTEIQNKNIKLSFPKESPLSSHMSRQAIFPRGNNPLDPWRPVVSPAPPPAVLHKAMGSFGRREVITPDVGIRVRQQIQAQTQRVPMKNNWFNRHDVISEFNRLHPSEIPTIRLNIQRRRPADWQASRK